jgi:hypothetical protein
MQPERETVASKEVLMTFLWHTPCRPIRCIIQSLYLYLLKPVQYLFSENLSKQRQTCALTAQLHNGKTRLGLAFRKGLLVRTFLSILYRRLLLLLFIKL